MCDYYAEFNLSQYKWQRQHFKKKGGGGGRKKSQHKSQRDLKLQLHIKWLLLAREMQEYE